MLGETTPYGIQQFLSSRCWDADEFRDDLRHVSWSSRWAMRMHVLIVDETGFIKKGTHSAGVQRQYSGTAPPPLSESLQLLPVCYAPIPRPLRR